jgi:hypothetical protein
VNHYQIRVIHNSIARAGRRGQFPLTPHIGHWSEIAQFSHL